jgi:BioD-like phosphotransacetylase family protein
MLVALFVTSPEKGSGKTAVCAGLGKHLQSAGKKVGYFKPVIGGSGKSAGADSDAEFMKSILSLSEAADLLSPAIGGKGNLTGRVKEAFNRVYQGKDVVIIEGYPEQYKAGSDIAKALNARVLVVEAYSGKPAKKADSYKGLGNLLLGVVLNKVPESRMEQARSEAGANVLGILPEDRVLFALTIGEIAGRIQGEVLRGAEQSAELVENIMLGALTVDHGPDYFGRKDNKMVVLRSDRPDMQMAAMETSTRCLVVTGDTPLKPVVLDRAEEKGMPIIVTKDDVSTVIDNIEGALGRDKLSQVNKVARLAEVMEKNLDFQRIYKGLGLPG